MGILSSKIQTSLDDQLEEVNTSQGADVLLTSENLAESRPKNDENIEIVSEDVTGQLESTTVCDPITQIHELCTAWKLNRPQFVCSVVITPTYNSSTHRHTAKCLVTVGTVVYSAEGVAGKKTAAKRIAARALFEGIAGRKIENLLAAEAETGSYSGNMQSVNVERNNIQTNEEIMTIIEGMTDPMAIENPLLLQKRLIAWNPIGRINTLCMRYNWNDPVFISSVSVSVNDYLVSHSHTVQCFMMIDGQTFLAKGVAGTKKAAKRIAAMEVYLELTKFLRQYFIQEPNTRS